MALSKQPEKAKFVVAGIKSPGQRAGPEKVLGALERLLPQRPDAVKEAYSRGYTEGVADERRKTQPKESE